MEKECSFGMCYWNFN